MPPVGHCSSRPGSSRSQFGHSLPSPRALCAMTSVCARSAHSAARVGRTPRTDRPQSVESAPAVQVGQPPRDDLEMTVDMRLVVALIARLRPAALVGTPDGVGVAQRVVLLDLPHEDAEQSRRRLVDQRHRVPFVLVHDPQQRRDLWLGLEDDMVREADGEEVGPP